MRPKKDETAVNCCNPALSVPVMSGVLKRLSRSISLAVYCLKKNDPVFAGADKIAGFYQSPTRTSRSSAREGERLETIRIPNSQFC